MKLLLNWDTSEIIENQANYLLESGEYPEKTKDELYIMASEDSDLFNIEWDNLDNCLTEIMDKKNKDIYWKVKVNNFGWRNLDGSKFLKAKSGKELLEGILPETECTFKIFNYRNGFAVQNYHHDSPTGNEWYYIVPCTYRTYEAFS
jgi:hypothetical protein